METDQGSSQELNQSTNTAEVVFKSPSTTSGMKLRERKRRVLNDDDYNENVVAVPAKRGRPKGSTNKNKQHTPRRHPRVTQNAESDLFNALRGGQSIGKIIDQWINEYEEDADQATVKLLQFFISSTGCKGAVTAVMIRSMEFKDIIENLSDEFDENSGDYPLVMAGNQWKKFRTLFGDFIMVFVAKVKQSIIFDESFTDYVLQLLTGLADSQIRAFRHTATFAAMKFSSAMVDIVVELVGLKEKHMRQIETEKLKLRTQGTNDRLDNLLATKAEFEKKISDLCLMIQFVFKSVFTHRYRDIVADIRCICIAELGNWMQAYPVLFLEDGYLKYIGWSLFDKHAEVRLKCVHTLLPLYQRRDLHSRLELFTSKFKNRIISMVSDKDLDVAIPAVQLITEINNAFPAILDSPDCVIIYEAVYCANRALAQAAGAFLNARVFQQTQSADNRPIIQNLLQFFIEGEIHNHAAFLVDALIDFTPAVKDWATMAEMLLNEEVPTMDAQLIEILSCSVRQSLTGEIPVGRTLPKKGHFHAQKDPKVLEEERTRFTEQFIDLLPKLLNKYAADGDRIEQLLQLAEYLQLDLFFTSRKTSKLTELMNVIVRVVDQNHDFDALKEVVKVLYQFSKHANVNQHTETMRSQLIDQIALHFRQSCREILRDDKHDEEDQAQLAVAIKKMAAFQLVFEISHVEVWDLTVEILEKKLDLCSHEVIDKGVTLLFYTLAHELNRACAQNATKHDINRIKRRKDKFLQVAKLVIQTSPTGVEQAFCCLCDMLVLFNYKVGQDDARLQELPVEIDSTFINVINEFVINNVFQVSSDEFAKLDQQSQIELTCQRRLVLGQYCKLILYGVLPIQDMCLVLRYYLHDYGDYGDILKSLINRTRDLDRIATAKALIRALINVYEDFVSVHKRPEDLDTEDFGNVRELSKRFAAFFTDPAKNREAVALIHQLGIRHAFALDQKSPQKRGGAQKNLRISVLELLVEFSHKLLKHDKNVVLKYLDEHANPPANFENEDLWQPFIIYRNSLVIRG